jgi:predicted RNA-binding Zn ribbon-like protein
VIEMQQFAPSDGLALAVRLLNSWDELEPDPELLSGVDSAQRLLRRHGYDDAAEMVDEAEVRWLRRLRTLVRAAWDDPDEAVAVSTLNGLLSRCPVQPQLQMEIDGHYEFRWDAPGRRVRAFAGGLIAGALLAEIRAHGRDRLGVCDAGPCRCVYVDGSKNRSRRYCCQLCADRANQAASRARRR